MFCTLKKWTQKNGFYLQPLNSFGEEEGEPRSENPDNVSILPEVNRMIDFGEEAGKYCVEGYIMASESVKLIKNASPKNAGSDASPRKRKRTEPQKKEEGKGKKGKTKPKANVSTTPVIGKRKRAEPKQKEGGKGKKGKTKPKANVSTTPVIGKRKRAEPKQKEEGKGKKGKKGKTKQKVTQIKTKPKAKVITTPVIVGKRKTSHSRHKRRRDLDKVSTSSTAGAEDDTVFTLESVLASYTMRKGKG